MTALALAVETAVRTRWPQRGAAWSAALPTELDAICADLGVTPRRTYPARYAHVVCATSTTGNAVVLRSTTDPDAPHQAAVLQRLADVGLAPRLHVVTTTRTATWTVADAIEPGTALRDAPSHPRRDTELLAVLRVLADGHAGPPGAPDLTPWIRARLTAPPLDDLPPGRSPAAPVDRRNALRVLDEMEPPPAAQLCHGDLSPGNALIGRDRLWLIDPRGINGEPAYDIAVTALKSCDDDPVQARPIAATLARAASADADRTTRWVTIAAAARV